MSTAAGGAAGGAAAAAAIANAIKASGAIVRVTPRDFMTILNRQETPLVLHATGGFLTTTHRYMCSYRGFAFFARRDSDIIEAKTIWIPG